MTEKNSKKAVLAETVVRICPACGVVNPSGPCEGCPHVQLVRFDGVDGELENLIGEVARARGEYRELVSRLRNDAVAASRTGDAVVETPHKAGSRDAEDLYPPSMTEGGGLHLTHPRARKKDTSKADRPPRRRKRIGALPVDPRQLDLLANSPPKGDA